uniref:Crossover junction endonuclease MUS81 n=1 Tax=Dendroctonus ponderosae TaxID=77166 RepID=A0AAR5QHU9_DENPD
MSACEMKRVSIRPRNPNPLFEKWLIQWIDQAPIGEDSKINFLRALKSLRLYPLPLKSGRECRILKGFNLRLCALLDEKLNKYKANGSSKEEQIISPITIDEEITHQETVLNITDKSSKSYVPKYRSGAYAILIALYGQSKLEDYPGYLLKADIIKHGKDFLDSSFTKPEPGSRYTAWSSMATLISKRLVSKVSNPAKFSLTDEGRILAEKLYEQTKRLELDSSQLVNSKTNNKVSYEVAHAGVATNEPENFIIDLEDDNSDGEPKAGHIQVSYGTSRLLSENVVSDSENGSNNQKKRLLSKFASTDTISSCSVTRPNKKQKTGSVKMSSASSVKKALSSQSSSTQLNNHHINPGTAPQIHFILKPNSFDIVLYVDKNETSGSLNVKDDNLLRELDKSGVKYEVKDLKVGDFTWTCRDRSNQNELVLPYIIERKRMDDFAQSIKDRRYYEQKFRLKKSGIENLIYLIENYGNNKNLCLPIESLRQAATNTAIQENFSIKFTNDYKDTAEYLVNFTDILEIMFKSKTLASCDKKNMLPVDINSDLVSLMIFQEFNLASMKSKKMTVSDLFVKMLIQIRGMSVERALAIIQQYPSPYLLKEAYESNDSESVNEKLLAAIKFATGKKIGPALSKIVFRFFCKLQY